MNLIWILYCNLNLCVSIVSRAFIKFVIIVSITVIYVIYINSSFLLFKKFLYLIKSILSLSTLSKKLIKVYRCIQFIQKWKLVVKFSKLPLSAANIVCKYRFKLWWKDFLFENHKVFFYFLFFKECFFELNCMVNIFRFLIYSRKISNISTANRKLEFLHYIQSNQKKWGRSPTSKRRQILTNTRYFKILILFLLGGVVFIID